MENDNGKKKLKVAIYIRVSTIEQGGKYGADGQLTTIENYLKARESSIEFAGDNFSFDDPFVFYDNGVSGAEKPETRDELSRLFYSLEYTSEEDRPFDVVIVYKIDRFARDLKVLLEIADILKENNVGFISTQESIDTSTPFGNAMFGILGVFAELEREMIKERTLLGQMESYKKGKPKKVPYGYRKDEDGRPIINEEESDIIKEIFKSILLGETVSEIIKDFETRKIPTPTFSGVSKENLGKKKKGAYNWDDKTIRQYLANEFYIGNFYYNKTKTIKNEFGKTKTTFRPKSEWLLSPVNHMPIIGQEEFEQVQEIMKDKKGNFSKSSSTYILGKLIICGYCEEHRPKGGIHWSGTGGASVYKYYKCAGIKKKNMIGDYRCKCAGLSKEKLEELVLREIKGIFNNLEILNKYLNQQKNITKILKNKEQSLNKLNNKIANALTVLDNIQVSAELGAYSPIEYKRKFEEQKLKIDKLKQERRNLQKSNNKLFNSEKYYKALQIIKTIGEKDIEQLFINQKRTKHLLETIIENIYIYSRDRKKTDIIRGGKRTEGQQIPYKIKIKFKLPQEFLREYISFSIKGK